MHSRKLFITLPLFLIAAAGTFLGVQFFTKTGLFKEPGIVTYDESLSEVELSFLKDIFTEDLWLDYDVTISAVTQDHISPEENDLLFDIKLPVVDFYTAKVSTTTAELKESSDISLISANNLKSTDRLLSLNGNYYLDSFESGALFEYLHFESDNPTEAKELVSPRLSSFKSKKDTLSFLQTGVVALSRGMNAKLSSVGDGSYFAEHIKDYFSSFDLTHISNESSFSGYATSRNICSDWRMVGAITAIGTDIIELTGNHNQDCGDQAALDTLDKYDELGIKTVGGGRNATEAAKPLEISEKDTNITFIAFNYSTGGMTYDNTPGANSWDEGRIAAQISEAKSKGNFVLVDMQFNECGRYVGTDVDPYCDAANSAPARDGYTESAFFRHIIDLGADMVVGTSAHQTQTFELYGNGVIYYGLGNLFFDQVWWEATVRSLALAHYFQDGKLVQTRLLGTVYGDDMQTKLLDEETLVWFINRLNQAR